MPGTPRPRPRPAYVEDEDPITGDGDIGTRISAKEAHYGARRMEATPQPRQESSSRASVPSDSGVSGLSQPREESTAGKAKSAKSAGGPRKGDAIPVRAKEQPPPLSDKMSESSRHSRRGTRERSPGKSDKRRESKAKKTASIQDLDCVDPDCETCQPAQMRRPSRRPGPDADVNTGRPVFNQNISPSRLPHLEPLLSVPARPSPVPVFTNPLLTRPRGFSVAERPASFHEPTVTPMTVHPGAMPINPAGYPYRNPRPASFHEQMAPTVPAWPRNTSNFPVGYSYRTPLSNTYAPPYLPGLERHGSMAPPKQEPQEISSRPIPQTRPSLPRPMSGPVLDFSTRTSEQPPSHSERYNRDPHYAEDHVDITTRPAQRQRTSSYMGLPDPYVQWDTPESSPERYPYRSDRERMPPPLLKPAHRPLLSHFATTPDAMPRHIQSPWPIVYPETRAYDSPSDQYDTDRTTRAVTSRRPSPSRYPSYHNQPGSMPLAGSVRQNHPPYLAPPPDPSHHKPTQRASSPATDDGLLDAQNQAQRYQDVVNGFKDDPALMSAGALRREARRRSLSHIPGVDSRRSSHRSKTSISSRTSAPKGSVLLQYGDVMIDLPADHRASITPGAGGGPAVMVIEDGRRGGTGNSVRSSGKASSGVRSTRWGEESEGERERGNGSLGEERRRRRDRGK